MKLLAGRPPWWCKPAPGYCSFEFAEHIKDEVDGLLVANGLVIDFDRRLRLSEAAYEQHLEPLRAPTHGEGPLPA